MSKLLDQLNQMTAPLKTDAILIGDDFAGTLEEQYITLEDFTKYFNDLTALTGVAGADILAILDGGTLSRKITVANLLLGAEDGSIFDGDHLDIDFTPSNYTPATTPAEAADVDDLAAHLYGIDQELVSSLVLLAIDTTEVAVVNDDTENTLVTISVPGGSFGAGNVLRLRVWGIINNTAGAAGNWTFLVKYGSTTLLTLVDNVNNAIEGLFVIDVFLWGDGATNAQESLGTLQVVDDGAGQAAEIVMDNQTASEDSTGALNLVVTGQMSAAHANAGFSYKGCSLEKLPA